MCREDLLRVLRVSRGQDWLHLARGFYPRLWWIRSSLFLIAALVMPLHGDARATEPENGGDWEEQGNLYIGRSGDPWGDSSSLRQNNIYAGLPPIENSTDYISDNRSRIQGTGLPHRRDKRGVVHLYNMVVCATGCNPLSYKGYGCYCGFLGSGYVIDGIDRCCKMHDWCYDATECPMFSEYFVPYYWKCYHGHKPICAVDHGDWGGSGSCAQRLCECDRTLAECLSKYPCPTTKAVCTSSPWRLVQNLFMIM